MKPVLAVDFDDVIANFNAAFSVFHNRVYGTDVEYERIFSHDMHLVYGCEESEMPERINAFYKSAEHDDMQPIDYVWSSLTELSKYYEIHIVTNRPASRREETWNWICRWSPNLISCIHFTNFWGGDEHAVKRPKSVVCKEIGAEVLIEDAFKHALQASEAGIQVLMPHRPWNRGQIAPNIIRVTSWRQATSFLLR